MVDTGFLFPTASSQDASGTNVWTNLNNLYADDWGGAAGSTYASVLLRQNEASHIATLSGFSLSGLPDSATVVGIEVILEAQGNGSGTAQPTFEVTVKGQSKTILGPDRLTTLTTYALGGASDTWGIASGSLSGAAFKSGFDVKLKASVGSGPSGQSDTRVDYLKIKITYTLPVGGKLKVWTGTAWAEKPLKYWNGSAWVEKPLKRWNGTAWELA